MQNKFLPTLTGVPEDYFGGALQKNSTPLWGQNQLKISFQTISADNAVVLSWNEMGSGYSIQHQYTINETSDDPSISELSARMFCHYLLSTVPFEGLSELYSTVQRIHEFYSIPPVIKQIDLSPGPIPVQVGAGYVRPDIEIAEE